MTFDNQFSIRQWRPMHTPESLDDIGSSKLLDKNTNVLIK